jgi:hypothetical protein
MFDKVDEMIEFGISDVVKNIATEEGVGVAAAIQTFYKSKTFQALTDRQTGLYLQGGDYLYELYKRVG